MAFLQTVKTVDRPVAYLGDIISYQISLRNTGAYPADTILITDPAPVGTTLVPGSLIVSVPYALLPGGVIALTPSMAVGELVTLSYKLLVVAQPNPNPIVNIADLSYSYTVAPNLEPIHVEGASNPVSTLILRNNYGQQINDLIHSVALQQAALSAILQAEGAKIQRLAATPGIETETLLCLNKSVAEMTDAIALLEAILRKKLGLFACQLDGSCF